MSEVSLQRVFAGFVRQLAITVGLVMAGGAGTAAAQPVLITAPQTVGPLQTEITPTAGGAPVPLTTADITVSGTTLTINGRHQIASLVVEPNGPTAGVVTHSNAFTFDYAGDGSDVVNGLHLIVGGDVLIDGNSRIDVSGRGYAGGEGPGGGGTTRHGGSYGGRGGLGSGGGQTGQVYGSVESPADLGSAGGTDNQTVSGAGGGALRLIVIGTLTVDGAVLANGQSAALGTGGSGGSMWITAGALSGSGLIAANGGNGWDMINWGGGGGGRIAIYTCDQQLPLSSILVNGGSGFQAGQPGTIFFGSGTISITEQPVGVSLLPGEGFALQAAATTDQPDQQLSYQWRKKDSSGAFVPLVEGQGDGRYSGVETPMLMVSNSTCTDSGEYDCLVQDSCGSFPTRSVMVAVVQTGDIANDFGSLGADGQVSFGDFLALLGLIGPCDGGTPGCVGDLADDFGTIGGDGQVSFGDFLALLGLIGPCP